MNTFKRRCVQSLVAATVTMATLVGSAYADGIKSQWKTRLPMPAGLVKVQPKKQRSVSTERKELKVQIIDEAVPRLVSQRKERRQARLHKNNSSKSTAKSAVQSAEPNFGVVDRIRSMKRMMKPASKCGLLHTHERARCLRDQLYRKTNQYRMHVAKKPQSVIVAKGQ